MMAYAEAAVRIAGEDHGMTLDFSPDSIAQLETVLAARIPMPEAELEDATRLWGGYFGEVFRRKYPAEWVMALYPTPQNSGRPTSAEDMSMPALSVGGSQIYPLLKVFRRITLGPGEDLSAFYAKVAAALDARAAGRQ